MNIERKALRLAIAATITTMFCLPPVSADSLAGSSASGMSGGIAETPASSRSNTQNSSTSGGVGGTQSSSSASTQSTSQSDSDAASLSGDSAIGRAAVDRVENKGIVNTGVKVKAVQRVPARVRTSSSAVRKNLMSLNTVRSSKNVRTYKRPAKRGWKTVSYNWKTGKKSVTYNR